MTDAPAIPATAPERICGDCVVYNDTGDGLVGGCSRLGYVAFRQPACRAWFAKAQLHAPLYGRAK